EPSDYPLLSHLPRHENSVQATGYMGVRNRIAGDGMQVLLCVQRCRRIYAGTVHGAFAGHRTEPPSPDAALEPKRGSLQHVFLLARTFTLCSVSLAALSCSCRTARSSCKLASPSTTRLQSWLA